MAKGIEGRKAAQRKAAPRKAAQRKAAQRERTAGPSSGDFYTRVYDVVRRIPIGRVTTYGAIAAHLGLKSAARTVGYALMASGEDMELPAQRVVNRNGELSGKHHFATPNLMRELLESEGVRFVGDAVDIDNHFWDPATELAPKRRPQAGARTGSAQPSRTTSAGTTPRDSTRPAGTKRGGTKRNPPAR